MPHARIALIHATGVAIEPTQLAFAREWPEAELVNLLDDSLSTDRAKTPQLTHDLGQRILDLADYAHRLGARAILFTCSAFGPLIDEANRQLPIPVLKPNEAMFEEALACGDRIGMIATFAPAVSTMADEFAEDATRVRPSAILATTLARGAMDALRAGDAATHNALVAEGAAAMGDLDAIMLAHFSTARALEAVRARTSLPVLSSPEAAVRKVRRLVGTA